MLSRHRAVLLLLGGALVLLQVTAAQDVTVFAMDMKLQASRITDAKGHPLAVGTATITNNAKRPQQVGKVVFDIRFMDSACDCHKDDIRQQFVLTECSGRKMPLTLKPGEKLTCPFKSVANIYGGKISVVAGSLNLSSESFSGAWTSFDVIDEVQPASWHAPNRTFKAVPNANIPGQDISCGQKDWAGNTAVFCKICGGKAAVEAACNKNKECVAFDMEPKTNCGYLKSSQGPQEKPAPGFTSWLVV